MPGCLYSQANISAFGDPARFPILSPISHLLFVFLESIQPKTLSNYYMNVLCLDGAGSRGIYSIGILASLERKLDAPLHEKFHYIYGTGTGAIIAALLGLGYTADDIHKIFADLMTIIMNRPTAYGRSDALDKQLHLLFEDMDLTAFSPNSTIGIVVPTASERQPIFRSNPSACEETTAQGVERTDTLITDALVASCAAYPFRELRRTQVLGGLAVNGSFNSINPLPAAIADLISIGNSHLRDMRIISVGTGRFALRPVNALSRYIEPFRNAENYEQTAMSAAEAIVSVIQRENPGIRLVRISEEYTHPDYATNMIDRSPERLQTLYHLGQQSLATKEEQLLDCLNVDGNRSP